MYFLLDVVCFFSGLKLKHEFSETLHDQTKKKLSQSSTDCIVNHSSVLPNLGHIDYLLFDITQTINSGSYCIDSIIYNRKQFYVDEQTLFKALQPRKERRMSGEILYTKRLRELKGSRSPKVTEEG